MSAAQALPIAVIGCGAVVRHYYAPALKSLEQRGEVRVVALVDPDAAARERLGREFPDARCLTNVDEAAAGAPALSIVASPPSAHAAQSIALLRSGSAVLCEKPLATKLADAEAMVAAAADAGLPLAAGMVRRFFPATQAIRQAVASGMLGTITGFEFCEGEPFRWPVSSPAYFRRETGGGVLLDLGSHALDLMIWWLGQPAEFEYQDDAMGGVEANCRLLCRFADGFGGELRLSRDSSLGNRYTIRGTRGRLRWRSGEAARLELELTGAPQRLDAAIVTDHGASASFESSFLAQLENVVRAARGREALFVPAAGTLPGLDLIARCRRRRRLMPMPWLSPAEVSRAEALSQSDGR